MKLVSILAKMCHYAQVHVSDPEAWSQDVDDRRRSFQCTSYQVACFISQHTVLGKEGVESDIVLNELAKPGVRTESEWVVILDSLIGYFGGFPVVSYCENERVIWTDPENDTRTIEAKIFALPNGGTNPLAEVILVDEDSNELFEGIVSDLTPNS